jgi:hypothetical protein
MNSKSDYFEDIKTIKKIMEESSRFLSLSGLSGVFAGLIALAGGVIAFFLILNCQALLKNAYFARLSQEETCILKLWLITDAALVLILALGVSFYFSYRKAIRQGLKIWTSISRRMLISFIVPLVTGGIFILILSCENQWQLIVPAMLIFYGLSLVNAGKFTYSEVFYLGLIEIFIGLSSAVFPGYGLYFWCLGFGFLHIAYGLIMYRKYEG